MTDSKTILEQGEVKEAAQALRACDDPLELSQILEFTRTLAAARGDDESVLILSAELEGYEAVEIEIPERRRVVGFASSFPVRAIGHLDPEEIFLANRDKFAQVSLTMGQPICDLMAAIERLDATGVIELRVPASEITGSAAVVDAGTEIHIYILPSEIQRIVNETERVVMNDLLESILVSSLGRSL